MTRDGRRAFLLWLLAMLAGAAIVWNSRFTADMSFFLPARPTAEQQVLVDQLKEGAVARLLMVAIDGGDAAQRAALSRELARSTRQNARIRRGAERRSRQPRCRPRFPVPPPLPAQPRRHARALHGRRPADGDCRQHRPPRLAGRPDAQADAAARPDRRTVRAAAPAEPRRPAEHPRRRLGLARRRARPAAAADARAGSDTDGQEAAIAAVREQFAALAAAAGIADARLQLSGPGLFAVKSRATIKSEVTRLSAISTLAIVAVLFFVYRSLRLLTLGLLPVLSGALAGVVAVSLAYGTVFGITVGFGSALIGEAVDYSIYYFVQSGRSGVAAWKARFWPTIRLGVLTSVCGFGALLFSGFPGLAQLGLYALTGIATAAIVTRFVLPRLADGGAAPRDLSRLGAALQTAMAVLRRLRWPTLALALAATPTSRFTTTACGHPTCRC